MSWSPCRNFYRAAPPRRSRRSAAVCITEILEQRQLLSCTIDVRVAGGAKSATVSAVGQVVNLQVWAIVAGAQSPGTGDGFQEVTGSLIGTRTAAGGVVGNLDATVLSPFADTAASNGKQQDLNGDGGLDVGGNSPSSLDSTDYFFPRDGGMDFSGVISGASQSFELATLTYTVTSLASGQPTNINFAVRVNPAIPEGVWRQDNQPNTPSATVASGAPVVISDPAIVQPLTTGTVTGLVFSDTNGNAKQDPGETTGIAGATVYADTNNNNQWDANEPKTTTDASGKYTLTNVQSGAEVIRQVLPSGFTQSFPTGGLGNHITVSSGQTFANCNFGAHPVAAPTTGTITGLVFSDTNGNAKQDSGETTGVVGVTVYADTNNNNKWDTGEPKTTTDASGKYTLTNVQSGAEVIRQILPSGFTQSFPTGGLGNHITVSSGQTLANCNFGAHPIAPPAASISGTVFNDANGDRIDKSESGLAGWTVYLDLNNNGNFDKATEASVLTDANGNYTFNGLAAGTYIVRVIRPTGWNQTTPTNNLGQHITVSSGAKATGVLFGEKKS